MEQYFNYILTWKFLLIQQCQNIFMSIIIDEGFINYNQYSYSFHHLKPHTQSNQQTILKTIKQDVVKNLTKILSNLSSQYHIENSTASSKHQIKLKIVFSNSLFKNLNVLIALELNLDKQFFQTNIQLLKQNRPYKIQTIDQRIMACKIISKTSVNQINRICVSIAQGAVKIIRPTFISSSERFYDLFQLKNKQDNFQNIIRAALAQSITAFKPLLKQMQPSLLQDSSKESENNTLKSIYRYIIRSPIEPAFDISFGSGKYDTMEWLTKEEIFNTNSMIQNVVTDFSQFTTHQLYIIPQVPLGKLKKLYVKQYFTSNDEQLNYLKEKAMHPPPRVTLNMESKYVYNVIQLNQNHPIHLKKVNMGGFSEISIAETQFWYMLSSNNQKMVKIDEVNKQSGQPVANQMKLKKQHKKWLVFKNSSFKGNQSGRNRIAHELKIVSKFKGASSIFMPEYFKVINQKSPFSNHLVMQYLPYPTLTEYVEYHKTTMSFLTKIHMASLIIQTLRFLKNYEIVHMDLKPSNIIISKRLITKLIDFGESYNKEICQKSFKPAFSMPYGSPQVFDGMNKCEFNEKNDVYSWAVIFFQLLFKRLPYIFGRQEAGKMFRQRNYLNYMFFAPEEQQKYGSYEIIPLIRCCMLKALDKDIKNRPCTLWLTVVLKQCLSYLINLQLNVSSND